MYADPWKTLLQLRLFSSYWHYDRTYIISDSCTAYGYQSPHLASDYLDGNTITYEEIKYRKRVRPKINIQLGIWSLKVAVPRPFNSQQQWMELESIMPSFLKPTLHILRGSVIFSNLHSLLDIQRSRGVFSNAFIE